MSDLYPGTVTSEQVESLLESAADLQKQIMRKYTRAILEETQYHLWIANAKIVELQEELKRKEHLNERTST